MTRILALSHLSIGLCASQLHKALVVPIYIQVWHKSVTSILAFSIQLMEEQNIYDVYKEKEDSALFQNPVGPDWVSYPKVSLDSIDIDICWRLFLATQCNFKS